MGTEEHYWKLPDLEKRFDSGSTGIRTLASAWLLAYFGGVGWLVSQSSESMLLPAGFLMVFLSFIACSGMAILFVMDQLVYHRLLGSVFLIGLKLEHENPSLPPIRHVMMKAQESSGTAYWEKSFYVVPMVAIILLSFSVFLFDSPSLWTSDLKDSSAVKALTAMLGISELALLAWVMMKKASVMGEKAALWFEGDKFRQLISKGTYEQNINQWQGRCAVVENTEADRGRAGISDEG